MVWSSDEERKFGNRKNGYWIERERKTKEEVVERDRVWYEDCAGVRVNRVGDRVKLRAKIRSIPNGWENEEQKNKNTKASFTKSDGRANNLTRKKL